MLVHCHDARSGRFTDCIGEAKKDDAADLRERLVPFGSD
jgi:hypothetical protein